MSQETVASFGHHSPYAFTSRLISIAQRGPHNWLGQQFAQIVRRFVLHFTSLPIDVEIGPIRMRCALRDNASEKKFVFMPWRFDARERQLLVDSLPRDGVFVDIGANVGIYSLTAATHLGGGGRIIALEPNPPAFARLSFNLEATRAGRAEWPVIDALQLGVGDAAAEVDLHLDPDNLGSSSIRSREVVEDRVITKITCRPLLLILQERAVPRVDVLKIDIEGAEDIALVPFLAAAPASLLPDLLIIENSEQLWKRDLVGALKTRGYVVQMRSRMNTVYRHTAA